VETTLPYPGLQCVDAEKTEATPVPAHVIAAARAQAARERPARRSRAQLHKWIVSVYRTVGFAVLTVVVLGLGSYLTSNVFYLLSSRWVTPAVISPTDERVLQLNARLAEQSSQRDKLAAERALVAASLADVERVIAADEKFGDCFRRAVRADVADQQTQLRKLRALAADYLAAKHEVGRTNDAFAGMSRARNDELKRAGVINEEGYLTGNYQLAQLAHANLQLAEKAVELDTRTATLSRESDALAATLARGDGALSFDALRKEQEYQRAALELEKARDTRRALAENLGAIDRSLARYDRLLGAIRASPLLVAAEGKVTVVLVPYENLPSVTRGGPLYGCALGFVACRRVGTVVDVMPGEMEVRHPFFGTRALRGQAVQVQLTDGRAAADPVLFAGRKPLWL
jgi:hypothetical protein